MNLVRKIVQVLMVNVADIERASSLPNGGRCGSALD